MDPVYTKELGEKRAQQHLEDTTSLVQEISDNTARQIVSEKVTNIINKEKLRKMLEEEQNEFEQNQNIDKEKQKNENI